MNPLIIANTQIRRDAADRYCLNDIHEAAVAAGHNYKRCQTEHFLRLVSTQELIGLLRSEPKSGELKSESGELEPITSNAGRYGGTYAVKELVYSYAMWISPTFHLHVIRSYDAIVTQQLAAPPAIEPPLMPAVDHRADQLVSAGRIFNSALRTARSMRMPPAQAMRAAFDCTRRHTGIDWVDELGASEASTTELPAPGHSLIAEFLEAWRGDDLDMPFSVCLSTDAYQLYRRWCASAETAPAPMPRFINMVTRSKVMVAVRRRWSRNGTVFGPHGFLFPPGESAPKGKAEQEWLGECVSQFREALDATS